MTLEQLRDQFRPQAERQGKARLALEKVAELENIEVSEEETDLETPEIQEEESLVIPEETVVTEDIAEENNGINVEEDGEYTSKEEVALYIYEFGHLPDNFITKI